MTGAGLVAEYTIANPTDWVALRPEVIVDPLIYRLGELFLQGGQGDWIWEHVSRDLGGLVSFFDLLVLHDRLPAFNYAVTFPGGFDSGDPVFDVVNRRVPIIDQVDVTLAAYTAAKSAALDVLRERTDRGNGELLPSPLAEDLGPELSRIDYSWYPSLGDLDHRYSGSARVAASFLLGALVFSTYAQQTGAPHVMSAKRSRLFAASALAASRGRSGADEAIYGELRRRFRDAGEGWRDRELPWTPSFLPWLVQAIDPYQTRPTDLLDRALELRDRRVIRDYRTVRANALSGDDDALAELRKLAAAMAQELRVEQDGSGGAKAMLIEVGPRAFGAVAGAVAGGLSGPLGAALGALAGFGAEEILRQVSERIWGLVFAQLPFVSSRKLLTRAVRADWETHATLDHTLRTVWETPAGS